MKFAICLVQISNQPFDLGTFCKFPEMRVILELAQFHSLEKLSDFSDRELFKT